MNVKPKSAGFTLVEIALTIVLVGILFTFGSIILRQGLSSYAHISSRSATLAQARFAMERMTRELRRVQDDNQHNIQNIQPNQISFVDSSGTNISFNLNGQTLQRNTDLLLDHVTALTFTGFRDNNAQTSSGQQTWRVRIQLSTLPPGEVKPITLRTDVFIRNYMYENFQ